MTALSLTGVDGGTGRHLPPVALESIAEAIRSGHGFGGDAVDELRYRAVEPTFGTVFGVAADDLQSAGWGIVATDRTPPDVLDALDELRELRRAQAGPRYREFIGGDALLSDDDKRSFLARHGMGSALLANPERVPYYLLLVGDPSEIPLALQYQLDVQYAVGRVAFDTPAEYARYAASVVASERRAEPSAASARLFGPRADGDAATELSADFVMLLAEDLRGLSDAWDVRALAPEQSTKAALAGLLGGRDAPSVLFTAGHGVGFGRGHRRQRAEQGALVCQEWPGPPVHGDAEIDPAVCFAGVDAERLDTVRADIVMSFACFGAATPSASDFPHVAADYTARPPFIARLPERLLAHEGGGALAFIGHVERAWGYSLVSVGVGQQTDVFRSALGALLAGQRVGHAMEYFADRYSALSTELHDLVDGFRRRGDPADDVGTVQLWTELNDSRGYIVLGDPAVRLGVAPLPDADHRPRT